MGRIVGSEYPLQVGGRDFALDLLLFHPGLNCLVALELKVGRFEPIHVGKLAFSFCHTLKYVAVKLQTHQAVFTFYSGRL